MLLIMAVAVAGDLHLPLVQAVAWARMYSHYREVYSPEVSLNITLSGQYPCSLCKLVVAAEKERAHSPAVAGASVRLLLPLSQPANLVNAPAEMPRARWRRNRRRERPRGIGPPGSAAPAVGVIVSCLLAGPGW